MTDKPENSRQRQASLAPETHNDEQDDSRSQAQRVTEDAQTDDGTSPLDSEKGPGDSGLMNDSTQDLVDRMRDMEQSGRIDMNAYRGEPNLDDNEDKYAKGNRVDDLPSDGS